jgi:hypothetical protein
MLAGAATTDSLELLNHGYPTVAPEDSEPGAPLPSTDPLLAYYRGFCREKVDALRESGRNDEAIAVLAHASCPAKKAKRPSNRENNPIEPSFPYAGMNMQFDRARTFSTVA